MRPEKNIVLSVLLVASLGFVVYANSLGGQFLWDDVLLVKDNAYIKDVSYFVKLFTQDIGQGADSEYNFYRPLQMLTYMADYALYALDARGYHLTNIILHILVAISVYFLILILFKEKALALFTSLLFVVHPIHTEAVTYISGRADSLAAIFVILSFIFYIRVLDTKKAFFVGACLVMYILGILSRENILIFPVLVFLYHYLFRRKIALKTLSALIGITIIYIFLRLTLLKHLLSDVSLHPLTFSQRALGFLAALTDYVRLLVLPFGLRMEYGDALFAWMHPKVIIGTVFIVLSLVCIFAKNRRPLVAFSLGWFFIWLLPHSNLYPLSSYMAEHWLYLSSIGLLVIGAYFLMLLYKRNKFFLIVFVGLLAFYLSLTIRQNTFWLKPDIFYERTLQFAPQSPRMHYNLGRVYYDSGRIEEAVASYKKAIEVDSKYVKAYYNLGIAYYHIGRKDEAVHSFYKAVEINPRYAKAYYNLGNALSDMGKNQEAIAAYTKAIESNPRYAKAYNNLGIVYNDLGRTLKAVEVLEKAVSLRPDYAETHYNLGISLSLLGRGDEAIVSYKKAIELREDYADAYNNMGIVYYDTQRFDQAIAAYKKALEFRPDYAHLYNNLGNAYKAKNDMAQAIAAYKKAIEYDPSHAMACNNLAVSYYYTQEYDLALKYCDRALELGYPVHPDFLKLLEPYRK